MLTKVYMAVWFFVGLAAITAYLTGYLGSIGMIVFGMTFLGLVFMGMIAVLPSSVGTYSPTK
jgi:hypothetical protein